MGKSSDNIINLDARRKFKELSLNQGSKPYRESPLDAENFHLNGTSKILVLEKLFDKT